MLTYQHDDRLSMFERVEMVSAALSMGRVVACGKLMALPVFASRWNVVRVTKSGTSKAVATAPDSFEAARFFVTAAEFGVAPSVRVDIPSDAVLAAKDDARRWQETGWRWSYYNARLEHDRKKLAEARGNFLGALTLRNERTDP